MHQAFASLSARSLRFESEGALGRAIERLRHIPRAAPIDVDHDTISLTWGDLPAFRMGLGELGVRTCAIRFPKHERMSWIAGLDKKPFSGTLFRGERTVTPAGFGSDPGDFGTGRYLTTSMPTAQRYGAVGAHKVDYTCAASGNTQDLAFMVDLFYRTCRGRDRLGGADTMRADFLEAGIQALLVPGYDSPDGHLTVVEFTSTPPRSVNPWMEIDWPEEPLILRPRP